MDIFEARRERAAEMNSSVSCSVIGEGPGTGGSGADGGADSGAEGDDSDDVDALDWGDAAGERSGEAERGNGDEGPAERRGEGGMKEGGAGKDSRRKGTAGRFSRVRDSVVCVEAMAGRSVVEGARLVKGQTSAGRKRNGGMFKRYAAGGGDRARGYACVKRKPIVLKRDSRLAGRRRGCRGDGGTG